MNNCFLAPLYCVHMSQITNMGQVVSDAGIQTHPDKLEALKSFPVPKNVKEVGIFLVFTGYYRRFVKNYVRIAKTLYDLLERALIYCEILGQSVSTLSNQFVITLLSIRDCPFLDSWLPLSPFVIALFSIRDCPFLANLLYIKNWAAALQNQQMTCAPSEDSDQPRHPFSDNVMLIKLMIFLNTFLS